MKAGTSGQDGGVDKHALPPRTAIAKNTTRLQNKFHPQLSENRAVWKPDNQGFKEVTFIQRRRRGGDAETWRGTEMGMGGPTSTCGGYKMGRIPQERGVRAPDHPVQGSQHQQDKSP